jgi:[acyl-carrier-protein] S-malonyltransferase
MEPAAGKLKPMLDEVCFHPAKYPVLANVTAEPYPEDPADYADLLYRQVCSPVLWTNTVRSIAHEQPDTFMEVGPGKVLRMLAAKTVREVPCASVGDVEGFKKALAFLSGETSSA